MRYFFEPELAEFLQAAGFADFNLSAFPETDRPPGDDTWTVLGVARAPAGQGTKS